MKLKLRYILAFSALLVIILLVKLTLFSKTVPDLIITNENLAEIEEGVQLDAYGFNRLESEISEGVVKRNQSLYLILRDLDVSPQVIYEINEKSKGVFQSNRVKPGQRYVAYKENEKAHRLVLHSSALDYVVFDWKDGINVETGQKELTKEIAYSGGVIESSLYETLVSHGDNILIANRLSEIFAWQIDFFRLYPGDSYKLIYEKQFIDGKPYGIGEIIAAEFTSKNRTYDAFYFKSDEREGYYDGEGNGVQKALLKAPFKYSQRISSGFNRNRLHPVLKRNMPHYGVDYAAPLGTPVLSVGAGEIIEAQYRGASGNIVKVRHNGTYTTAYLHLNGFASGIRSGIKVQQGQVIGYVGKTGRVTGVHLDYRIYMNGQPVNPLTVDLPPSKALEGSEKEEFLLRVNELEDQLNQIDYDGENVIADINNR
jgi:murein DD-endopeptidase MepM/ murein hydrolase activator NlpD